MTPLEVAAAVVLAVGWFGAIVIAFRKRRAPAALTSIGLMLAAIFWLAMVIVAAAYGGGGAARSRIVLFGAAPILFAASIGVVAAILPKSPGRQDEVGAGGPTS